MGSEEPGGRDLDQRKSRGRPRLKNRLIHITMDPILIEEVDRRVANGPFRSRSSFIEYCVREKCKGYKSAYFARRREETEK